MCGKNWCCTGPGVAFKRDHEYGRQVSRLRQTLKANLLHPTLKEYSPPLSDMFIYSREECGFFSDESQKSLSEHPNFVDVSRYFENYENFIDCEEHSE
jgi:hypothetical protein